MPRSKGFGFVDFEPGADETELVVLVTPYLPTVPREPDVPPDPTDPPEFQRPDNLFDVEISFFFDGDLAAPPRGQLLATLLPAVQAAREAARSEDTSIHADVDFALTKLPPDEWSFESTVAVEGEDAIKDSTILFGEDFRDIAPQIEPMLAEVLLLL